MRRKRGFWIKDRLKRLNRFFGHIFGLVCPLLEWHDHWKILEEDKLAFLRSGTAYRLA
jgi:hypothetical protein